MLKRSFPHEYDNCDILSRVHSSLVEEWSESGTQHKWMESPSSHPNDRTIRILEYIRSAARGIIKMRHIVDIATMMFAIVGVTTKDTWGGFGGS